LHVVDLAQIRILDEPYEEIVSKYPMKGGVRIRTEERLCGIVSEFRFRFGTS